MPSKLGSTGGLYARAFALSLLERRPALGCGPDAVVTGVELFFSFILISKKDDEERATSHGDEDRTGGGSVKRGGDQ